MSLGTAEAAANEELPAVTFLSSENVNGCSRCENPTPGLKPVYFSIHIQNSVPKNKYIIFLVQDILYRWPHFDHIKSLF